MKSLSKIRVNTHKYKSSEAYAQYLFRTNKAESFDSWLDFMGAYNNRRKISRPLIVINGGLK